MITRLFTCAIAALALASCSSSTEITGIQQARETFLPGDFQPPARFTALFNEPRPILDVEFIELGVAGKLIVEQQDGDFVRYLSADLGGIVLQNGMLHSMFGFGEPLSAADLSAPLALVLAGRNGIADRFHTYTDGEGQAVSRTYRCSVEVKNQSDVAYPTRTVQALLITEDCQSLNQTFQNTYWVNQSTREIIQSRQWAGPTIGSLVTRVTPVALQ